MQDTKGVVGKLENIFAVIIHALFAVAYLTIFQVSRDPVSYVSSTRPPPQLSGSRDVKGAYL